MDVVSVIPARGNSKGIPGKNVKKLGGMPLVAWSVLASLSCPDIDLTIVSSEDDEILDIVRRYSKLVSGSKFGVIRRPKDLSQDWVQCDDVAHHALRLLEVEGISPKKLVVLQATSPFRTTKEISKAIKSHLPGIGCVISGNVVKGYHWLTDYDSFSMSPTGHTPERRFGRQWNRNPDVFKEDGSIYVIDAARFKHERVTRFAPYVPFLREDPKWSVDIDTPQDWEIAERLAKEVVRFP